MERLKKLIFSLAVVSGILLLTSATIWAYIGLTPRVTGTDRTARRISQVL